MTSGICLKIIQEERGGCGWGRIDHGLMVVGLCEGCLGFIVFFYFGVCSKSFIIKCFRNLI